MGIICQHIGIWCQGHVVTPHYFLLQRWYILNIHSKWKYFCLFKKQVLLQTQNPSPILTMLMTRRRIHPFGITAATSIRYSLTRLRMCHTVCPSRNSATTTFTPSSPESCLKMCSLTKFRKKSLPYYRWTDISSMSVTKFFIRRSFNG